MRQSRLLIPLAAGTALALGVATPIEVAAQDYTMYETQYVRVLPGHSSALQAEIAQHNKRFHSEGPYTAQVHYIMNGPHTGKLGWVMGPATFTQLSERPADDSHDSDWDDAVLAHGVSENTEYWRVAEGLSYEPATEPDGPQNILLVRYFEVADNALFSKVQGQIKAMLEATGSPRPRIMYRKQFAHRDGRNWAFVVPYGSWAELDEGGTAFAERFIQTHGEAAFRTFGEEAAAAIVSREDEWRQLLPQLGGQPNDQ